MLTLQLNASYEPMRIIPWQDAICMWLKGTVDIVAEYAERVYHAIDGWSGKMPAVIRLKKYISAHRHKVKFSRRNVFGRDFFSCLYCGAQPGTEFLTYDHVTPRSRGGKTTWDNIATCCWDCNEKKADRTPAEAGMSLRRQPVKPKIRPQLGLSLNLPNTPDEWRDFLYWETELET
jgi:5-methylcytosine-specific restriction endonuclease McrA